MIIRLSKSGKAVLVVSDQGETYITSVHFLKGLLDGKSPYGFLYMKKLKGKTDQFKPSDEYGSEDVFGAKAQKKRDEDKPMGDTEDW